MTDQFDRDRILGNDAIIQDVRQFKRLEPLGLPDEEIAHRMATDSRDVGKIRNLVGRGKVRLHSINVPYHVRVKLGGAKIKTVGNLLSKTDKELLSIRGIGPKLLIKLKEAVCKFMEEDYDATR